MSTNFSSYELKIDYQKNANRPERIFQTMADLISDFQELDEILLESFPSVLKVDVVLEEIEVGSIKTKLKTVLTHIPDSALEALEWKKILGAFLIKAKYAIIEYLSESETIESKETINRIKDKVIYISEKEVGYRANISSIKLLDNISKMSNSIKSLTEDEKVMYISSSGELILNRNFNLTTQQIEELLIEEINEYSSTVVMQVKKPDYTGQSKWDFHLDGHIISVKIRDREWLGKFQSGKVILRPGDSIEALLRVESHRDDIGIVINEVFELMKVKRIIHESQNNNQQIELF